jgi:hypothetical protein
MTGKPIVRDAAGVNQHSSCPAWTLVTNEEPQRGVTMRCTEPGRHVFAVLLCVSAGFLTPAVAAHPAHENTATADSRYGTQPPPRAGLPAITDSVYTANHPRLLYSPGEIPALYSKVRDGGADDTAYSFIRILIQYIYPGSTFEQLLAGDFGLTTIPNLGLGSVLQSPPDPAARDKGRLLTLYIADNYAPGDDNFETALRLRSLALGYDMFFEAGSESERAYVRDEILSYIDMMTNTDEYEIWSYRPYLANVSVMIASSLGLAAICLDGEIDPAVVKAALDRADHIIREWSMYQLDEGGAYNEGAAYGSWSMRHLVYYFWARVRYDGYDYASNDRIRNMERWFAYELLPSGGGAVNNIQDCSTYDLPVARNTTYFDWAQTAWGSRLSAYIWDHVAGTYGYNAGTDADKAGTVIWHQNLVPQAPGSVLRSSAMWEHRGLYYFRTGWPTGASSKDILFSFYSGKFQGGHAQEDQNQFTLYAYGVPFAIDHGPGAIPKESEAHNMILIDGKGQHNAGSSIGTDGDISTYLLNDFSDYIVGDATKAYATHSPVNNRGFPFPTSDWSWGDVGSNPVEHAYRSFFVVRSPDTPPYFVLIDDIDKDGSPHAYEWRLHTGRNNTIDTSVNPIRIAYGAASMRLHVVNPPFSSLQKTVTYFNNQTPDADSNVLSLGTTTADPFFVLVLVPGDGIAATPTVTSTPKTWGLTVAIAWPNGKTDVLVINRSGAAVTFTADSPALALTQRPALDSSRRPALASTQRPGLASTQRPGGPNAGDAWLEDSFPVIETDAGRALVRFAGTAIEKYVVADAGTFAVDGIDYVKINNGTATVGFSGTTIDIDGYDADFSIFAPGVSDMFCRGQRISVVESNGFLTRDPVTAIPHETPHTPALRVRAYPNPFNPTTTVSIELEETGFVTATLYDAQGRRVRSLWNGPLPAGSNRLDWSGENDAGAPVASGVYFLTVTSNGRSAVLKVVLVR